MALLLVNNGAPYIYARYSVITGTPEFQRQNLVSMLSIYTEIFRPGHEIMVSEVLS